MKKTRKTSKLISRMPASATVRIADLATQLKHEGHNILDFSAGRAVESSPEYINTAAVDAIMSGDTHQTMGQGTIEYRKMVSKKLMDDNNVYADPDNNIIATLGCKNGLTLTLLSLLDPGDEVIVEDPCFVSYFATINIAGGKAVPVTLDKNNFFRWKKEDLEAKINSKTKAIIFCSPQNPTGVVHTEADLKIISEVAIEHDLWVITDEIYERLTLGGRKHRCIATLPGMQERTISLMGFTKTFSMGGWRIGFAFGPEEVISNMVVLQQHLMTCAGSFTQAGAAFALSEDYREEVLDMWKDWERRCEFVYDEINAIDGLSCMKPEGAFYAWINIESTGLSSEEFAEKLLKEKYIALVPGSAFGKSGEGYLRMTCVKSWDDIREGVKRLNESVTQS